MTLSDCYTSAGSLKRPFAARDLAEAEVRRLALKIGFSPGSAKVYRCPSCGAWHLARRRARQRRHYKGGAA